MKSEGYTQGKDAHASEKGNARDRQSEQGLAALPARFAHVALPQSHDFPASPFGVSLQAPDGRCPCGVKLRWEAIRERLQEGDNRSLFLRS